MANYWTNYSFVIDKLTDAQLDWWEKKLEALGELHDTDGYDPKDLDENGDPKDGAQTLYGIEDWGNPDSSFTIERHAHQVWCNSNDNEGGNVDGMIQVIQEYLAEMDPKRIVSYQWCGTCSKPRLDAYCGGAVAISKDRVLSKGSSALEDEFVERLKKSLSKKKKGKK